MSLCMYSRSFLFVHMRPCVCLCFGVCVCGSDNLISKDLISSVGRGRGRREAEEKGERREGGRGRRELQRAEGGRREEREGRGEGGNKRTEGGRREEGEGGGSEGGVREGEGGERQGGKGEGHIEDRERRE